MRERERSLAMKVQQAALWEPTHHGTQHTDASQLQQASAEAAPAAVAAMLQQSGYVNICGIELPFKRLDGANVVPALRSNQLICTAAVQANMLAAALALCQNRPLLLEGPPGDACTSAARTS